MSVLVQQPAPEFTAQAVMPDGSFSERQSRRLLRSIRHVVLLSA